MSKKYYADVEDDSHKCPVCGKTFCYAGDWGYRIGSTTYCSWTCTRKAEKNPELYTHNKGNKNSIGQITFAEEKKEMIMNAKRENLKREKPYSDKRMGEILGIGHSTAGRYRKKVEAEMYGIK